MLDLALPLALALWLGPVHTVDRIVALVDEDPILLSDLDRALELGFVERRAGESEEELRRRALDQLIVQRLRYHAVDAEVTLPVAEEAVAEQVEAVRTEWRRSGEPDASFEAWLEEEGLTPGELRRLLARQLRVLVYVEERLGPRVFVDLEEITAYYEEELQPRLEAEGAPIPPLPEIREQIRSLLRQRGLDREIERWTQELRSAADVVDLLDPPEELPPVVETRGPLPGAPPGGR